VKKFSLSLAAAVVCVLLGGAGVSGQDKDKPLIVSLKVEIVISRYQGEKKISSLPYTLSVNTNLNKTSLRLGSEVPISTTSYTPAGGDSKESKPLHSYQYRPLGTNIDCTALTLPDGRYRLDITIEDSSIYANERPPAGTSTTLPDVPSFRLFKSTNSVLLRDGQSMQFTAATDKVTGEVTKVDVSLTALK
jgi:Flp pilus assembly secretin CpaC